MLFVNHAIRKWRINNIGMNEWIRTAGKESRKALWHCLLIHTVITSFAHIM